MELRSLTIVLKPSAAQQADLEQLLGEQQDPSSSNYHRWLTPEEYADRFGASSDDIATLAAWLEQNQLHVSSIARSRNWISFSGTAGDVEQALGTRIHRYEVNGELHFANATEPAIPEALVVVVRSVRGLNDFRLKPKLVLRGNYTSGTGRHYLSPDDLATIYNIKPLYDAGIDGSGQSIVIAGQTQINLTDIQQFRSRFNLPASDPQVMLVPNRRDPGTRSGDLAEAHLDLEWSGAVAPNASLIYVYSDDVMDAVQYAIDQNLAPVLSLSYGLCETLTSSSDALTLQSWARQGNVQGMTWFTASGDSGGADCVSRTSTTGGGEAVDVPAAIPEVTAVGGTEFNEGDGQYWNATNNVNGGTALGYIPEMAWNDSSPGDPAAGGGGASVMFLKPAWQTGAGVPNNNARNVPDVSLSASASHDGFLVHTGGSLQVFGGTSVSAPAFTGIAALLNQYLVSKGVQSNPGLGNMNPKLYSLAQRTPSAFHDITEGNNIVSITCSALARNCTSGSYGFNAGPGYDQATGLGSVDAYSLVLAWNSPGSSIARRTPTMTLSASAQNIPSAGSATLTAVVSGGDGAAPLGTVTLYLGGATLGTATLAGTTATLTVNGGQLPVGANTITAQYSGDSSYTSATASVTINVLSSVAGPPTINAASNGASFRQGYTPGMLLSIFGSSLAPSTWSATTVPLPLQLAGVSATVNGLLAPLYYVSPTHLNIQIPYEAPVNSTATVVVNNNGQTTSRSLPIVSAAPGVFTDATGALVPASTGRRGQVLTMYITGQGAVSPTIATGSAPAAGTSISNLPAPLQAASVLIGDLPAAIQFIGIPPGLVGVTQINFQIPAETPLGAQPVSVVIGTVPSIPATLTVTP